MVNNNGTNEPKKRKGLFGSRKSAVQHVSAEQVVPESVVPEQVVPEQVVAAPVAADAESRQQSAAEQVVTKQSAVGADDAEISAPKAQAPARSRAKKTAILESADAMESAPIAAPVALTTTSLLFQAPPLIAQAPERSQRGSSRNSQSTRALSERGTDERAADTASDESGTVRRRSRRRPGEEARDGDDAPNTVVRVRQPRPVPEPSNEPTRVKGSTRLEAKKQRRRDGRDAGRRRPVITESEFLARRESVDRVMVVRSKFGRIQIAVLEDGVLVEHYVAKSQDMSLIGNVYLGRVQNVLPSMEAAFVDIGRGRNAVLYSGEVDWDAAAENSADGKQQARRIELALKPGDKVLVQVTKDPIGHKGARLTSQVSLPGRYLVYVPNGSMNGISRKLPDTERARLKKILKEVLPDNVGVIVRTAAEGATEDQLTLDVSRLTSQWAEISRLVEHAQAPVLLHSEPDLLIKIIRDVFNEDFHKLVIEGEDAKETIETYLRSVAPDLIDRVQSFEGNNDSFDDYRISEQIEKALDRKVWLPSGGSLVIDRTEAMTVVDVNTGKFVGSGGNLEETVTKNNLEAAEEIVRQLRLRDIGGIIVVDFIDMVLESNRDLVLRRLVECLSRDRTKHQVAEVTSLGLVQMTRKKLGLGLLETFSEPCEHCAGRGIIVHHDPVTKHRQQQQSPQPEQSSSRRGRGKAGGQSQQPTASAPTAPKNGAGSGTHAITEDVRHALAQIAASTVVPQHEGDAHNPTSEVAQNATKNDAAVQMSVTEPAENAHDASSADAGPETVEILDIPVVKASRNQRRISSHDAEQILDSVLESLPEPKQPGQGRGRTSRRAGSAGAIVSAPITED
ncbi:MAG: Rne/Rng family ribonuclease [Microbacteriaceae bacterium]